MSDYEEFVKRMGSFDMELSLEGKERQQTDAKTLSEKAKSLIESQGSRTVASCKAGADEATIAYAAIRGEIPVGKEL